MLPPDEDEKIDETEDKPAENEAELASQFGEEFIPADRAEELKPDNWKPQSIAVDDPTALPPSAFHPSQIAIARRVIEAIRAKFGDEAWSKLDSVDFRIFVPNFNQLVLQTALRTWKCGLIEDPRNQDDSISDRVWSYSLKGKDARKRLQQLETEIDHNQERLFLLVADECEWGATVKKSGSGNAMGDTEQADAAANDRMVNSWLEKPNVVVLLVSATPEALLSTHSRVPLRDEAGQPLCIGYRLLEVPDDADVKIGQVLTMNDDRAQIERLLGDSRYKMHPLSHIVEWFEKKDVVHGSRIIVRSYNRLLLVSYADQRFRYRPGNLPTDTTNKLAVSRDTTFEDDQFELRITASQSNEGDEKVQLCRPKTSQMIALHIQNTVMRGKRRTCDAKLDIFDPSAPFYMHRCDGGDSVEFYWKE